MLNIESLAYQLLERALPGVKVIPELDVDANQSLPVVVFAVTGGAEINSGGGKPSAWGCALSVDVIDGDIDDAIALAGRVYDAVWAWDDVWQHDGTIDDLGSMREISDTSIFTRTGTESVDAHSITQLSGAWDMQAHQA